ncbi:GLABROUS1 enhancer-binding protein-like [Sesamum indicum]|uniref:GLABROUS1 enhancer-binding protein-like n=1 Tax=Sesamum indicum TaxID=4182 RepID=A0A6I9U428_SESIN|nr:GLABROUS1 enhancer-binding protein-like [Sesamum indicum]
MAKNREPEKPVESETESGEEEDSEDAGSQDSDSEPDLAQVSKKPSSSTQATPKKAQPQSSSKPQPQPQPQPQPPSSSDEEESGFDSDESDPNVKPIASKPMENEQKSTDGARKLRSKPIASDLVTPAKSTAAKRPAEEKETDAKDAKKKKKAKPDTTEKKSTDDSKKLLFQRVWSEDDEIVILQGMIDYVTKKKSDPVADLNAFHDFIKKNLHADMTRTQLQDKIRRLKRKYQNNKSKDKTFSKPHEQKAYELSKKIWGNESGKENGVEKLMGNGSALRKNRGKRPNTVENEEAKDVNSDPERLLPAKRVNSGGVTVEERIWRIGAEYFESGKGLEGEKEWKKLKVEEMEVNLRQLEVKTAQAKLVLDAVKSGSLKL